MGRTRFFSHIPYQRLVRRLQKPETAQEKSLAPRVFSNRFGEHTDDNGDHLRCGDHFRSGIICGNVHLKTELFPIPRTLIPYETDFCSLWLSLFFSLVYTFQRLLSHYCLNILSSDLFPITRSFFTFSFRIHRSEFCRSQFTSELLIPSLVRDRDRSLYYYDQDPFSFLI